MPSSFFPEREPSADRMPEPVSGGRGERGGHSTGMKAPNAEQKSQTDRFWGDRVFPDGRKDAGKTEPKSPRKCINLRF